MKTYWLSSRVMTIGVEVDENDIITKTPPIAEKFIGQKLSNLIRWMEKQGHFRIKLTRGSKDG